MKIAAVGLFVNTLITLIVGDSLRGTEKRKAYNFFTKIDHDPLFGIDDLESREFRTLLQTDEHIWGNILLTPSEADQLLASLPENSTLEEDVDKYNLTASVINSNSKQRKKKHKPSSPYITSVPNCQASIKNVEFFIMDDYINPSLNRKEFKGVTFAHADTGLPKRQCLTHGTYVASEIVGNTFGVIRHGDRRVYNIPVFNCATKVTPSAIYSGLSQAIARANANKQKGIRSILNWSLSGGGRDATLDAAVAATVKANIFFGLSSGNNAADVCDGRRSPWGVPGVFIIGGTTQPGDHLAHFSNYGSCVIAYFPSTFRMYDGKYGAGSSFAIPQFIALAGLEAGNDTTLTNAQVSQRVISRATMITNTKFPYQLKNILVMERAKVCPRPSAG